MTERVDFGDLLRDTAFALTTAHLELVEMRFDSRHDAARTIAAYRDSVAALALLARRLLHPDNPWMIERRTADGRLAAGVRLCDALETAGRARPWRETWTGSDSGLREALAAAGRGARSAQDLLATHWDPGGAQRTPTAEQLDHDLDLRWSGLRQVAGLARSLADLADPLAINAVAAGTDTTTAARLAADGARIADAVHLVPGGHDEPDQERLRYIEVARPTVRTHDPVLELADRVARLHRFAWLLTRRDPVGVGTLRLYAMGGVELNLGLADALDLVDHQPRSPLGVAGTQLRQRPHQEARRWLSVHTQLLPYRSATPAVRGVAEDVVRIRELVTSIRHAGPSVARHALPMLLDASAAFEQIRGWNAHTLRRVHAGGELWIAGKDIPRDVASTHPELASAKLHGRPGWVHPADGVPVCAQELGMQRLTACDGGSGIDRQQRLLRAPGP